MREKSDQKVEDSESYDALVRALQMLKRLKRLEGTIVIHEGILLNADTLLSERQVSNFVREVKALLSQYKNGSRPLARALLGFDGGNIYILNVETYTFCFFFGDLADAEKVENAADEFLSKWVRSLRLGEGASDRLDQLDSSSFAEIKEGADVADEDEEIETGDSGETLETSGPVSEPNSQDEGQKPVSDDAPESEKTEPSMPGDPLLEWTEFREKVEALLSKVVGRAQAKRIIERELSGMGVEKGEYLRVVQFRPFGMRLVGKTKDRKTRKELETELLAILEDFTR